MRRETSDSVCACFSFVFSKEEEDGVPSKTETKGCFLARPGRGSDSGQITIEMMTETKPRPLTVQREQPAHPGEAEEEEARAKQLQCMRWMVQVGPLPDEILQGSFAPLHEPFHTFICGLGTQQPLRRGWGWAVTICHHSAHHNLCSYFCFPFNSSSELPPKHSI